MRSHTKNISFTFLIVASIGIRLAYCQLSTPDTFRGNEPVRERPRATSFIAPAALLIVSVFVMNENAVLDRYDVRDAWIDNHPDFHTRIDNYLQFAPIAVVGAMNLGRVKGQSDFPNEVALLIKSEILVHAVTQSLKAITGVRRPDETAFNSFPSGHTAQAFMAATFMSREYGSRSVWYGIGAYTVATGVGALRIMNNRHWLSDVVAGAAIGILSTNVAYMTHRYKWGKGRGMGQLMIVPDFSDGVGIQARWGLR